MDTALSVAPSQPISRLANLTVVLSNTRTDRGNRPRNRSETYVLGVVNGQDLKTFTPSYDLFSFCCYRALILGSPAVIIGAKGPGSRKLLTEPLPPQRLKGEEKVDLREWSNRMAVLFHLQTGTGRRSIRRFFGYRHSDIRGTKEWFRYDPKQAILDPRTGAPPLFASLEDFQQRSQVLNGSSPLTKSQAWSTWQWLLIHKTFHAAKVDGQYLLTPWHHEYGIVFSGVFLRSHGC